MIRKHEIAWPKELWHKQRHQIEAIPVYFMEYKLLRKVSLKCHFVEILRIAIEYSQLSKIFNHRMRFIHFVCMEINELCFPWTIPHNAVVVVVLLVLTIVAMRALFCDSNYCFYRIYFYDFYFC